MITTSRLAARSAAALALLFTFAPAGAQTITAPPPDTFTLGSWGAQIVDELTPVDGDIVLDRTRMSVFNGTGIDNMLRNLGVRTLLVVGAWTNMAVEHTIRDAADYGYEVTIVTDATSSLSAEWQDAAVGFALTNIATASDTATVTTALRS